MSKPGPSKILEALVGALLPPACREHVLGDLQERYRGNRQFLSEALLLLPMLVVSRIRRTADAQILLIEAFAVYLSFVAAGWQFYGASFLYDQSGFLRLVVPAVTALGSLLLFDAYFDRGAKGLPSPFQIAVIVIAPMPALGAGLLFQLLLASVIPSLHLPFRVLLAGAGTGALLVSGLRSVLQARLRPSTECEPGDPSHMSPEEIRSAALRMYKVTRIVRVALCASIWVPALVWVPAMWHSPSLLYRVGCGMSLAGWVYAVYMMQRGLSRGHLEADPSLAMCLEFCRSNLEGRRDILRYVWPRLIVPLLAGTLIVLAADPEIVVFWKRIPGLVVVSFFYCAVGWFMQRKVPAFQRQIDAYSQAQRQP